MRDSKIFGVAGVMLAAGWAMAGGTISDGDASLQLVGVPVFSSNLGDCTFLTDTGGPDQGFKCTWYYRTEFNNQNRYMSFLDTPSEVYAGDTATLTYTNAGPGVAGQERFDARIQLTIEDGSVPNRARVVSTCVFKSRATAARTYQVFALIDLDLAGGTPVPASDDEIVLDTGTMVATHVEQSSSNVARIAAVSPTRWQAGSGSSLRTLLNGGAGNLTNAVGPVSGDVGIAFQWTLTLQPNEEVTLRSAYAINDTAFPTPLCVADVDDGSGSGTPDGGVTIDDLIYYLTLFEAGDVQADVDDGSGTGTPDAGVTIDDLIFFLTRFEAGC